MRIIWMRERKTVYKASAPGPNGEITCQVTQSRISISPARYGEAKKAITSSEEDKGVFYNRTGRERELQKITVDSTGKTYYAVNG